MAIQRMTAHPAELLSGFVGAVLALLIAFGVEITKEQVVAIGTLIGFLPGMVTLAVGTIRSLRKPKPLPPTTHFSDD